MRIYQRTLKHILDHWFVTMSISVKKGTCCFRVWPKQDIVEARIIALWRNYCTMMPREATGTDFVNVHPRSCFIKWMHDESMYFMQVLLKNCLSWSVLCMQLMIYILIVPLKTNLSILVFILSRAKTDSANALVHSRTPDGFVPRRQLLAKCFKMRKTAATFHVQMEAAGIQEFGFCFPRIDSSEQELMECWGIFTRCWLKASFQWGAVMALDAASVVCFERVWVWGVGV